MALPASPARGSGWGTPFRVGGPTNLDVVPAQIAFSPAGSAAIGFSVEDIDRSAVASAYVSFVGADGTQLAPRRVPGARYILDAQFVGGTLALLTATSPWGRSCCRFSQSVRLGRAGTFGRAETLVGGQAGPALGRVLALPGQREIAVLANGHGVWASESRSFGRFGVRRRLTRVGAVPQSLATANLGGGASLVAWTEMNEPRILVARGSRGRLPGGRRVVVTVPGGHALDELAVASRGGRASLAWIESWLDHGGHYHSQAMAADLSGPSRARSLSPVGELASGLSLAANNRGDELAAWKACSAAGTPCAVHVSVRPPRHRFGRSLRIGRIDASESPQAALSPSGEALLGWVLGGRVLVAERRARGGGFRPPELVSTTSAAVDLTVAAGPVGNAIAAWTDGTFSPSVMAVTHRTGS